MKRRTVTNVAASIRAQLRAHSGQTGEDFQFLLQRFASERFLYRLGQSPHRGRFVLKGAMLFVLWGGPFYRPSRGPEDVLAAIKDVCEAPVADDGLFFDPATLVAEPIRDDSEYHGLRVKFRAFLEKARIPMQIDIGFGDAIEPPAAEAEYPTLFDLPAPRILVYPHEAVVAEKLHAAVILGERSSRYKDFYDLHVLARHIAFDGTRLSRAIVATFDRQRTPIGEAMPSALTPRFYADDARAGQWRAFLNRTNLTGAPLDFTVTGESLQTFLRPVWQALSRGEPFTGRWSVDGKWQKSKRVKEF
jgi:hypothetical protein